MKIEIYSELLTVISLAMAPAIPRPARASPLANKKVLTQFKKNRVDQLRMEDIMKLGTEYMKKQTSIRLKV